MLTRTTYKAQKLQLKENPYFLFLLVGFAVGDETGLEGMGKTGLCFGRKVRVKGIQTENLVLLKLLKDRNTLDTWAFHKAAEILSVGYFIYSHL